MKNITTRLSRVIAFTAMSLCFISISSCKKESEPERDTSNDYPIEIRPAAQEVQEVAPHVIDFTGQICILFGDGFNDSQYVADTMERLNEKYGSGETGDLFYPVVYPDDLKNKVMNLREKLNERDISGLLLLGAPSGTHSMLYFLTNYWEGNIPYPIFSFCPKDDTLGQQAYCNMIFDCQQTTENEDSEQYTAYERNVSQRFLDGTINYIFTMGDPLENSNDLYLHAKYILNDETLTRYINPETGLASMKHFVIGAENSAKPQPALGSTILLNEEDEEGPSLAELEGI